MGKALYHFWVDEAGQDFTEYTLLIAVMAVGAFSLLRTPVPSVTTIWTSTNTATAHAAVLAGS